MHGYNYHVDEHEVEAGSHASEREDMESETRKPDVVPGVVKAGLIPPIHRSKPWAMEWVREALFRSRGRELPSNFNHFLIGELFWEQSSKQQPMAVESRLRNHPWAGNLYSV